MHLSALAVKRPIATTMLILAAVLLGSTSLARLEMTLLPDVRPQHLTVWVPYPDAGVAEIEEGVARPIEEQVVTVRGVSSVRSEIVPGGARVTVRLHPGTDPELAILGLRERLDTVRWTLPEGVERPVILGAADLDLPIMVLALAADDLPLAADWARDVLEPRLTQIDGVARAEVVGAPEPEVRVVPDPELLAASGITVTDIATALGAANVVTQGGYLRRREIRYAVSIDSALRDAADVERVVVARRGDRVIELRDVAEVIDGFEEPRGWSRLDGRPAVGLLLTREAGANLVATTDRVRERLDEVRADFPAFEIAVVADASPFVRQSISGVWQAVWLGGLLAYGVLLAFLGDLRSPLFLIVALPVSVVTSFALLDLCGISLNLMSLGGLALGIGMLVDNAIICLENVHRLRATGMPAPRAAAEGAREVAMPMLASTLTTCAVFAPLSFVPGTVGELFRDQAVAVGISLGTSLVTALTLLPMLAGRFAPTTPRRARRPLYDRYHRLLDRALDRPGAALAITVGLLVASGLVIPRIPRELFPELDTGQLELSLRLPPGTDVTATDVAVREVETWLDGRPEVLRSFTSVGAAVSVDPSQRDRRANQGTVRVLLDEAAGVDRDRFVSDLLSAFDDRPGWELGLTTDRPELAVLFPAGEATLTCEIRGPDPAVAERLAATVQDRVDLQVDGHPLRLAAAETEPRLRLELDEEAVARLGLDEAELLDGIEAETSGLEATRLRRFDEEHPVRVQVADPDPRHATLVAGDRAVPVDAVFVLTQELAPARLVREDQARVATIRWDGPLRRVPEVRASLDRALAATEIPPGYTVRFGGSHREMAATLTAIGRAFALSAGLVLLILAAQFESVTLPLLIFAAVPLALVGTAAALLLTGTTVNAISGMGFVVLIGIVVNDAILKVDLFRRLAADGMPLREAIHTASRRRYRPILMTTATTALALLPMMFGRGTAFRAPLAVVVIGGLVSATLLTLVVIPILYQWLARRTRRGASPVALTPERSS